MARERNLGGGHPFVHKDVPHWGIPPWGGGLCGRVWGAVRFVVCCNAFVSVQWSVASVLVAVSVGWG